MVLMLPGSRPVATSQPSFSGNPQDAGVYFLTSSIDYLLLIDLLIDLLFLHSLSLSLYYTGEPFLSMSVHPCLGDRKFGRLKQVEETSRQRGRHHCFCADAAAIFLGLSAVCYFSHSDFFFPPPTACLTVLSLPSSYRF